MAGTIRKLSVNLAAAAAVVTGKAAVALRLRRPPDGWRRGASVVLRSEASKFALTAFGLDLWSDVPPRLQSISPKTAVQQVVDRLEQFFRHEPACHFALCHRKWDSPRVPTVPPRVRLVHAGENADGDFDGCVVRVEQLSREADPRERFRGPDLLEHRHRGMLNIVARLSPDAMSVDLWVQIHHSAADGVPMQEMLNRLRQAWGTRSRVLFPSPEEWESMAIPRPGHAPGQPAIDVVQDFVDFTPLLELRRRLNDRLNGRVDGGIPIVGLLVWRLAQDPLFAGLRFATTVDAPAGGPFARAVQFVPLRPADYIPPERADAAAREDALAAFARDYNQLLEQTRRQTAPACRATHALGLIPPRLIRRSFELNSDLMARTYGTVGVTIIRDAEVFISPMSDVGFPDGFIAIGNMRLPCGNGSRVGSVSVKGPAGRIGQHMAAIRCAVAGCAETRVACRMPFV